MTKSIKLSKLKIDKKLTQLRPINLMYVSRYRQAYRTGANMPMIIIEKGTDRVTSGNHRLTAMLQEYGPDQKMEVIEKSYKSEKEVLGDFIKENVDHGNALDGASRTRLSMALIDEGATYEEVAELFNVAVIRIKKWGEKTVIVTGKTKKGVKTQRVGVAKRGSNIKGKTVTEKQYKKHTQKHRGLPVTSMANQLSDYLDNDWVARDENNTKALNRLYKALDSFLSKGGEKAVNM